jgi:catechol 2,3-dioxygenase-like lactoylglutathione lyase family enzyme
LTRPLWSVFAQQGKAGQIDDALLRDALAPGESNGQDGFMTVTGRLELVALDAPDIDKLSSFYAELTGWKIVRKEADWITMQAGDGREIAFQLAPDHVPPQWPGQERPQQFHLDLQVADHVAAAKRAEALGATRLADGPTWITLADPAGHPFDLCQKDGVGPVMDLFAVTIDAPDASALAHFYASLMGMEVTYDGPEGALIAGGGQSVMFQQISDYTAPQWPDPAHPQQAHLDIHVDDLDRGEARALELGARKLDGAPEDFRVFADPAGHPFCLTV